jgi:hypothetical protein
MGKTLKFFSRFVWLGGSNTHVERAAPSKLRHCWALGSGLQKYLPVFLKEEIDFATLLTMCEEDLKAVGVKLFGPRRKLATALDRYREQQTRGQQRRQQRVEAREMERLTQQLESAFQVSVHNDRQLLATLRVPTKRRSYTQLRVQEEVCVLQQRITTLSNNLDQAHADRSRLEGLLLHERDQRKRALRAVPAAPNTVTFHDPPTQVALDPDQPII